MGSGFHFFKHPFKYITSTLILTRKSNPSPFHPSMKEIVHIPICSFQNTYRMLFIIRTHCIDIKLVNGINYQNTLWKIILQTCFQLVNCMCSKILKKLFPVQTGASLWWFQIKEEGIKGKIFSLCFFYFSSLYSNSGTNLEIRAAPDITKKGSFAILKVSQ